MANWRILVEPDAVQMEVLPGESLLTAMTRQAPGLVPVGCRGGGCGICKVKVLSGRVELGPFSASALPPAEQENGVVLACKATPRTDLVLERVPLPRYWRPSVGGKSRRDECATG